MILNKDLSNGSHMFEKCGKLMEISFYDNSVNIDDISQEFKEYFDYNIDCSENNYSNDLYKNLKSDDIYSNYFEITNKMENNKNINDIKIIKFFIK